MDVKHTTIDKASVRREAAVILDLTHKDDFKQQHHMSTTAAPPRHPASATVPDRESNGTSAPTASSATTDGQATEDRSPQASFMGIPPELRLYIYEALWPPTKRKYTIHSDTSDGRISDRVIERAEEDKNETRTALLRVNKQICQEAAAILQSTSDLTLKTTTDRERLRLAHGFVTPGPRTHVTSIRVSMDVYELSAITKSLVPSDCFTRDLHPNVEMLQILLDLRGRKSGFTRQETAGMMFTFISEFAESPRLKSVAFELYSTPGLFGRCLHGASADTLCGKLQRSLREEYGKTEDAVAAIDVVWSRRD
ncbi:unnamed protein product [Zymoseptoria tritici ST99CH_3D1]|nr:unnamed protein product [Zymoseptoria tritici ST99CH_3D1]